jgi:(S)-3,5-dihydroxyphenylglycine transaminase
MVTRNDVWSDAGSALTLADYARLARERLAPAVWDFVEGGAGQERTLAGNREAFDRIWLRPRALAGPGTPDPAVRILGQRWPAPFGVAPLAYHTLVHPDGELATVRAAGEHGLPVVVSTFAGRTFEELAAAAQGPLWLQVYCFRDRSVTQRLVERAVRAGFQALVLTVDTPRLGRRLRDVRNRFRLPDGVVPANLPAGDYGSPQAHAAAELDPTLGWWSIGWLGSVGSLPVFVKGVLTAPDAVRALVAGADGIIVSNHGGRQLDGALPTIAALPEVAEAVASRCPVLLDGGVRSGTDVLVSLASGADAVLLGRPVLHGLAAGGRAGVAGVLDIVRAELSDAMTLAGVRSARDAGPELLAVGRRPLGERGPHGPVRAGGGLHRSDLHASVSDPLLSTMNFLNEITSRHPSAISFAPGRPYEGFAGVDQVFEYLHRYVDHLKTEGNTPAQIRGALFQYGPTAGQIRELIAESLRLDEGIDVSPESIVVTVGGQEAMLLVLRVLMTGPDDVLLVSSPCYVGIAGAARVLDVALEAVPERANGLSPEDLEAVVSAERARGRRPRLLYLVPDHANPSGVTLDATTRPALLAAAARHDLLILEDSPYRLVSKGPRLPTLKALDRDRRVILMGSFSKTVSPGARVGFVVADQPVIDDGGSVPLATELAKVKSMVTVNTSSLSQAAVAGALLSAGGRLAALNTEAAEHYAAVMRRVLDALDRCLPAARRDALGVSWNRPAGGFFLTVRVSFRVDDAALARSAEQFGVVWTPMSYFHPGPGGEHEIRLAVSYLEPDQVDEGVARLARFIEAETTVLPHAEGRSAG